MMEMQELNVPCENESLQVPETEINKMLACHFEEISIKNSHNVVLGHSLTVHGNVNIISGSSSVPALNKTDQINEKINLRLMNNADARVKFRVVQIKGKQKGIFISFVMLTFIILLISLFHKYHSDSNNHKNKSTIQITHLDEDENSTEMLGDYNNAYTANNCLFNETITELNEDILYNSLENANVCRKDSHKKAQVRELYYENITIKTDVRFVIPKSLLFVCTFIEQFACSEEFHEETLKHINECFYDIYYHFIAGVDGKIYPGRSLDCKQDKKFRLINDDSTLVVGISYCYSKSLLSKVKMNGEFKAIMNLLITLREYSIISDNCTIHFPKFCEDSFLVEMLKTQSVPCQLQFYSSNRALEKEILLNFNDTFIKQNQLSVVVYDETVGSVYDIFFDAGMINTEICFKTYLAEYINITLLDWKSYINDHIQCKVNKLILYKTSEVNNNFDDSLTVRHIIDEKNKIIMDLTYIKTMKFKECNNVLIIDFKDCFNVSFPVFHGQNSSENGYQYKSFLIITRQMGTGILKVNICENNTDYVKKSFPFNLMFDITLSDYEFETEKQMNCLFRINIY